MGSSKTKKLPSVVISLFVINENEYSAACGMLESAEWRKQDTPIVGGLPHARFAYRGVRFSRLASSGQLVQLDLVRLDVSSNLPMSVCTMRYFDSLERDLQASYKNSLAFPARYAILYGCAGAIPKEENTGAAGVSPEMTSTSGITYLAPVGDVVIVKEATWVENGEWVTEKLDESTIVDVQLSKDDRHGQFKAECPPDLRNRVQTMLDLEQVSALCTDKVVKLQSLGVDDVATGIEHPVERSTLRELLRRDYRVVDMESYGFLVCVPEDLRNVLVIRVLTDTLGSKSNPESDVLQHDLLAKHAATTLSRVIASIIDSVSPAKQQVEGADAQAVSGVLLQLARQSAYITRSGGRMRLNDLRKIAKVASMRLADLNLEEIDGAERFDFDERQLFEIASHVVHMAKYGYATARFESFGDVNVFDFLEADPIEMDFESAYEGWMTFCKCAPPANLSVDYRHYWISAKRALERICRELSDGLIAQNTKPGESSDVNSSKSDRLVFRAKIKDKQCELCYGEVILTPSDYPGIVLEDERYAAISNVSVRHIAWDGFESDGVLLDALRSLVG